MLETKAMVTKHLKTGVTGLLIETEMENSKCVQWGHCCLDLSDAYQTSVPDSGVNRWKRQQQTDNGNDKTRPCGKQGVWPLLPDTVTDPSKGQRANRAGSWGSVT